MSGRKIGLVVPSSVVGFLVFLSPLSLAVAAAEPIAGSIDCPRGYTLVQHKPHRVCIRTGGPGSTTVFCEFKSAASCEKVDYGDPQPESPVLVPIPSTAGSPFTPAIPRNRDLDAVLKK